MELAKFIIKSKYKSKKHKQLSVSDEMLLMNLQVANDATRGDEI